MRCVHDEHIFLSQVNKKEKERKKRSVSIEYLMWTIGMVFRDSKKVAFFLLFETRGVQSHKVPEYPAVFPLHKEK